MKGKSPSTEVPDRHPLPNDRRLVTHTAAELIQGGLGRLSVPKRKVRARDRWPIGMEK